MSLGKAVMEPDRAIEIVEKLADGANPYNGEQFLPFSRADCGKSSLG